MSLAVLFHFLCAQHASDINISTTRSLRLFCWITTLVVLFLVRNKNNTTNVLIQQNSRKLLMMDILMSETFWAHKKWNKIKSDIKLVFYSSTTTMMHGQINVSVMKFQNIKAIYFKHINLLYKLATCFIIRPSYWIMSLKRCVHYCDPC